jgi:hypothetical protein
MGRSADFTSAVLRAGPALDALDRVGDTVLVCHRSRNVPRTRGHCRIARFSKTLL